MATACPVGFDKERFESEIRATYSQVAENPGGDFHFHRGPIYAARQLGYDIEELRTLPSDATAPFAGVGNPFKMAPMPHGATVVDIGSGAGMDCLLAARRVGKNGAIIGVDMTEAMLARARAAAEAAEFDNVRFEKSKMADLSLESASVDVVISNGVFNLATDKDALFSELYRVVRPGGRVQFADITIETELSEGARDNIDLWTGCIAGAMQVAEMIQGLEKAGFRDARVCEYFDSFLGTSKEDVARKFGVCGANFIAYK